jgi:hypothetical protein
MESRDQDSEVKSSADQDTLSQSQSQAQSQRQVRACDSLLIVLRANSRRCLHSLFTVLILGLFCTTGIHAQAYN